MYAIIEDSGTQFKVEPDNEILIDLREAEQGKTIVFDNVIALNKDGLLETDAEKLKNCSAKGIVIDNATGPKLTVATFKRRKNEYRHKGHRQHYVRVRITEIVA